MKLFFLNLLLLFFLWIKLHGSEHKNTQLKIHNPEKFLNKKEEKKYQKIMEWFKQNNIQSETLKK